MTDRRLPSDTMEIEWAAGGAVVGMLAGAGLRATVYRMSVPSGEPERTDCARCGQRAAQSRWLAVRCGQCRSTLGTPLALELVTAAVLALLALRFAGRPELIAFAFLGVLGVALAAIDIAVQRLPDRLTLPGYPITAALLAGAALIDGGGSAFLRALLGGLALATGYLLLALIRPGQLGGGDIKLAGLLGMALAWLSWPALVLGGVLGFVLMAVISLVLLAARKITLSSHLAFGPFMLGGALLAAVTL